MRFLPTRNSDQKRDDVETATFELAVSCGLFAVGGALLCLALFALPDVMWLTILGGFMMVIGTYAIVQSVIGVVLELTVGLERFVAVMCCALFGFLIVNGYWLLTSP